MSAPKKPLLLMTAASDTAPNTLTRIATYKNYADAFIGSGCTVVCASGGENGTAEQLAEIADGLFLTGGVDVSPKLYGEEKIPQCGQSDEWRDRTEAACFKAFMEAGKPVFGICRGMQMINVLMGGTLYQDISEELHVSHPYNSIHEIDAVKDSIICRLFGEKFIVNSFHHQAVESLAPGLLPLAYSADGGIIEGFYHKELPILAVQWHPERMTGEGRMTQAGPDMAPLFQYFTETILRKDIK